MSLLRYIFGSGRSVPQGACVNIDHTVRTFTVTIRSINYVGPEAVKAQLQKKWEVVGTPEVVSETHVAQGR
jgi:hypothetical protein